MRIRNMLTAIFLVAALATAADLSSEMILAARDGDVATVEQLIAKGEDVNATNNEGVTALMLAAAANRVAVVKVLIKAGADSRIQTKSGKTALFFADSKGNTEVVKLLNQSALRGIPKKVTDDLGGSCSEDDLIADFEVKLRARSNEYATVNGTINHKLKLRLSENRDTKKVALCPGTYTYDLTAVWLGKEYSCSGEFKMGFYGGARVYVDSDGCAIDRRPGR